MVVNKDNPLSVIESVGALVGFLHHGLKIVPYHYVYEAR